MAKTKDEIDKLKRSWADDPSWDLEETEGFEAHREDLLSFRRFVETERLAQREMAIQAGMRTYECSRGTFLVIEIMQQQISAASRRIEELENHFGLGIRP